MSNKNELDKLIEIELKKKTESTPTLNLDMLVEMIQNMYPDHGAGDKPAAFDQQINPEMIANELPPGQVDR